jgi:mannose-6-phosphate isomerase-like protein (cupin superfamily)
MASSSPRKKAAPAFKRVHELDPAVAGMSLEEISTRYVARFGERKPDWNAFADAKIEGWRRAQHRFIGNTSGKPGPDFIPAGGFTLSVMYVPPGQGNASHTHEIEEVFFVLQGHLTVFFEEEDGRRIDVVLGPWDCASCPAGVIHGYHNATVEPVYTQVMVGKARPDFMGYADVALNQKRASHLDKKLAASELKARTVRKAKS